MGTPTEGLARLREAVRSGVLDRRCEELGLAILVVFGSAVVDDPSQGPNDLDVAIAQMAALTYAVETAPMRRRDLGLLAER